MRRNILHNIILIGLSVDFIRADRYEALEDALTDDYDTSTSTSSRSLYRLLGYIISWLFAIFVLRILVLLAGKIVACLSHSFTKLYGYMFPDNISNRSGRRGSSIKSLGSVRDHSSSFTSLGLRLEYTFSSNSVIQIHVST